MTKEALLAPLTLWLRIWSEGGIDGNEHLGGWANLSDLILSVPGGEWDPFSGTTTNGLTAFDEAGGGGNLRAFLSHHFCFLFLCLRKTHEPKNLSPPFADLLPSCLSNSLSPAKKASSHSPVVSELQPESPGLLKYLSASIQLWLHLALSVHPSYQEEHMDGFYESGIVVLPVPPDQERSNRLPSPNSWSWWEGNMIMDDGNASTNGGACGARLDILQDDRRFDLYLDLLDKYRPSYKNMSPVNEETVYDFFYRDSLMADLHSAENEQKHETFCFCSQCDEPFCFCSQSDSDVFPAADSWLDIVSSPGLSNYTEKLVNLEEQSLLARDPNDGGCETPMVPLNMKDYQLLQDSPSSNGTIVPSCQFGPCYQAISETSPEEVALEELKMVMTQLSDRTRICFRDALYRLADNSKQRPKRSDGQERGSSIRKPLSWSSKEANESKTNVIDRAIANMVFNRIDCNLQEDHSESAPADLDLVSLCACGAPCSGSNLQLVCHDDNELQFSHEFEVPVLGSRDG